MVQCPPIAVGSFGSQLVARINPLAWTAVACLGRALDVKKTGAAARDFHLAAGKRLMTKNANPLVVERVPVPEMIRRSKDSEAFV